MYRAGACIFKFGIGRVSLIFKLDVDQVIFTNSVRHKKSIKQPSLLMPGWLGMRD